MFWFRANLTKDLLLIDSYLGWKLACVIYCMFIGTDLASAVFWNLVRLIVILPPWGWEVMGLVLIRSGAVRTDTCCCRPPAMFPLLVGAIEYSVSGCSCVISFFFRCPCTSTLCWLYKICKTWFLKKTKQTKQKNNTNKIHSSVKTPKYPEKHTKYIKLSFLHARTTAGRLAQRLPEPKLEQWHVFTLQHRWLCFIIRLKIDLMSVIWQLYCTHNSKENEDGIFPSCPEVNDVFLSFATHLERHLCFVVLR